MKVQSQWLVVIILTIGFVVLSFFWWPYIMVQFEVPKVILFRFIVASLSLIFIYDIFTQKRKWNIDPMILTVVIVFVLWATITSFWGVDIVKSFYGNYYRKDGLLTLYSLAGFSLILSYFWNEYLKKHLFTAISVSSIGLSLFAILEILTHRFGIGSAATFGNPNFLAGYLVVGLPIVYSRFKRNGLILPILALILISAEAATLTLVLFALIFVFFKTKGKKKVIGSLIFFLIIVSSIGLWFFNYHEIEINSFLQEGRVRIYRNLGVAFTQKPLLGWGWSNVDYAFDSVIWPPHFVKDIYVDKAHSEILEILVTTGIPGAVLYLTLGILLLKKVRKDFTLLAVLLLYLFHAQTNVISIMEQALLWLVIGIAIAL